MHRGLLYLWGQAVEQARAFNSAILRFAFLFLLSYGNRRTEAEKQ